MNHKHSSRRSKLKPQVQGNGTEMYVLPPHILEKLGINLAQVKNVQAETSNKCTTLANLNSNLNAVEDATSFKKPRKSLKKSSKATKDSSIMETASLMKKSVFLSPTFLSSDINGQLEITNSRGNKEVVIESSENEFRQEKVVDACKLSCKPELISLNPYLPNEIKTVPTKDTDKEVEHDNEDLSPITHVEEANLSNSSNSDITITTQSTINSVAISNAEKKKRVNILAEEIIAPSRFCEIISKSIFSPRREAFIPLTINAIVSVHGKHLTSDGPVIQNALGSDSNNSMVCHTDKVSEDMKDLTEGVYSHVSDQSTDEIFLDKMITEVSSIDDIEVNMLDVSDDVEIPQGKMKLPSLFKNGQYNHISDHNNENNMNEENYSTDLVTMSDLQIENITLSASKEFDFQLYQSHNNNNFLDVTSNVLIEVIDEKNKTDLIKDTQIVTDTPPFLSNLSVNESDFNFIHLPDVSENNDINKSNHANSSKHDSSIILQSEKTNDNKSDDTCYRVSTDIQIKEIPDIINQGNNHVECNKDLLLLINSDQDQDKTGMNEDPIENKRSENPLEESRYNNLVLDKNQQVENITHAFEEENSNSNVKHSPLSHEPVSLDKSKLYESIMKGKEKEVLYKYADVNIKNCCEKIEALNRKKYSVIEFSSRNEPVNFNKSKVCKSNMQGKDKEILDKNAEPHIEITSPKYQNIENPSDKIVNSSIKCDNSGKANTAIEEIAYYLSKFTHIFGKRKQDIHIKHRNSKILKCVRNKVRKPKSSIQGIEKPGGSQPASTEEKEFAFDMSIPIKTYKKAKIQNHKNKKLLNIINSSNKTIVYDNTIDLNSEEIAGDSRKIQFCICNDYGCLNYELILGEYYEHIHFYHKDKVINPNDLFNEINHIEYVERRLESELLLAEEEEHDQDPTNICWSREYFILHQKSVENKICDEGAFPHSMDILEESLPTSQKVRRPSEDITKNLRSVRESQFDTSLRELSVKAAHSSKRGSIDCAEFVSDSAIDNERPEMTSRETLRRKAILHIEKKSHLCTGNTDFKDKVNSDELKLEIDKMSPALNTSDSQRNKTNEFQTHLIATRSILSPKLNEKNNISKEDKLTEPKNNSERKVDDLLIKITNQRPSRTCKVNTDIGTKSSMSPKLDDKTLMSTEDKLIDPIDEPLTTNTNERFKRKPKVDVELIVTKRTRSHKDILNIEKNMPNKTINELEIKIANQRTQTNERQEKKSKIDPKKITIKNTSNTLNKTNVDIEKGEEPIDERLKSNLNIDSEQAFSKITMPSNTKKELSIEKTGNVELKKKNIDENNHVQTQSPKERPKNMSIIGTVINAKAMDKTSNSEEVMSGTSKTSVDVADKMNIKTESIDKRPRRKSKIDAEQVSTKLTRHSNPIDKTVNSEDDTLKTAKTDVGITNDNINNINTTDMQQIKKRRSTPCKIDTEQYDTNITRLCNPIDKTISTEDDKLKTIKTDVGLTDEKNNERNSTDTLLAKERTRRNSKIDTEQTATKITRLSKPIDKTVSSEDDTFKTSKTDRTITNNDTNEGNITQIQQSNERPRRKSMLEAGQVTTSINKKKSLGSPILTKDLNSPTESSILSSIYTRKTRRSQSNNNPGSIKVDANTKSENVDLTEGVIPPRRKSQRGVSLLDGGSHADTPEQKKRKRSSLDNATSEYTTSKIKHQTNISDNQPLRKYESQRAKRVKVIQSSDNQNDNSDDEVMSLETKSISLQQESQNSNKISLKTRDNDKMKEITPESTEEKSEIILNSRAVGKNLKKASKPKEIAQTQLGLNIPTLDTNEQTSNLNKREQETGHIVPKTFETTSNMSVANISLRNETGQSKEMVVTDKESPPGIKNRKSRGRSKKSTSPKDELKIHENICDKDDEYSKTFKETIEPLIETIETVTKYTKNVKNNSESLTETDVSVTGTELNKSILETNESNEEIIKMNVIDDNEPPNKIKRKRGRPSKSDMAKKNKSQTSESETVPKRGKKRKLSSASERSNTDTADFDNTSMISMPEMDSSSVNESDYMLKHDLNTTITEYTMDEVTINRTIDSLRSSMTTDLQETITSSVWDSSTAASSQAGSTKMSTDKSEMCDTVECAVCNEVVKETDWIEHICIVHKYLAWKKDEKPIPLTNPEAVFQHLNTLSKELGGLKCRHCGVRKKYVKTFNKHVDQCVADNSYASLNTSQVYNTSYNSQMDTTLDDSQLDLTSCAKCAVCKTVVDRKKWISHIEEKHNYLAWEFEDENPPDFQKREELVSHLERICEGNGGLKCGKCSDLFKKVPKYLKHTETCSSSETENDTPLSVVKINKGQLCSVRDNDSNSLTCAVCSKEVSREKWQNHAMEVHYNIAWPLGAEPIDIKNPYVVIKHMTPYKIKYNMLMCNVCKTTRASILGFYAHILTCGKTQEEIDEVMEQCETCSCRYLVIYRAQHQRDHRRKQEEEERRRRAMDDQAQREAEASQPPETTGRRRAAQKALSVLKSIQDEDKKDVESASLSKPEDDPVEYSSSEESAELSSESDITEESSGEDEDELEDGEGESEGEEEEGEGLGDGTRGARDRRAAVDPVAFAASQRAVRKAADEFYAIHFSVGPLFPQWRRSDCLQLSPDEVPRYQQLMSESCKVRFSKESGWRTYKPLEARGSSVRSIYLGASPSCMSWAGAGAAEGGGRGYLAVALHRGTDCPRLQFDRAYSHPSIIQLWDFGYFLNNMPQLVMGIAHNYGTVWSMSWCPSGARDLDNDHTVDTPTENPEDDASMCDTPKENLSMCNTPTEDRSMCNTPTEFHSTGDTPMDVSSGGDTTADSKSDRGSPGKVRPVCGRLGLLALACSDGVVYVLSVPYPDTLCSNDTYYCKLKPVAELRLYSNKQQIDYQATSVFWSLEKGHTTITASYSNGVVAHYDLSTDSPLLTSQQDGVQVFHPFHDEKIHSTCVTDVSCHPSGAGAGALASSSVTGSVLSLRAGGGGGGGGALLCRLASSAHVHQIDFAPHCLNVIKVSEDPKMNELSLEPGSRLERRVAAAGRGAGCGRCGLVAAFSAPYLHLCTPHPAHLLLHKRKIAAIEMIPLDAKRKKAKSKSPLDVTVEPATYEAAVQRYGLDFTMLSKAQLSKGVHKHTPYLPGPAPERFPLAEVAALAFCPSRAHHDRLALATHAGFLFLLRT